VQPFGNNVLREVVLRRKREDMEKARVEKARMEANTIELDRKIFEEELIACQNRKGGANPQRMFQPRTLAEQVKLDAGVDLDETVVYGRPTVEYRFTSNSAPLRTEISIKQTSQYEIVCKQQLSRRVMAIPLCCDSNHKLIDMQHSAHAPCSSCKKTGVRYHCEHVNDHTFPKCRSFMLCEKCVKTKQDARLKAALGSHRHQTYLCLPPPAQLSLRVLMDSVSPGSGDDAAGGMAGQGAAVLTGERLGVSFSVTMEIMLPHLPSKGGKMALLRFSPSPRVEGRAANRREASVYVVSLFSPSALKLTLLLPQVRLVGWMRDSAGSRRRPSIKPHAALTEESTFEGRVARFNGCGGWEGRHIACLHQRRAHHMRHQRA
jgi:hypothetical protein